MDIYDMLDTIAEDTKARYITRIVDTGDAYVVNVCDVGGKPVFAHPYQYPYKPDAKKVTLLDSEWYKKYSEGKVLYENEVILAYSVLEFCCLSLLLLLLRRSYYCQCERM